MGRTRRRHVNDAGPRFAEPVLHNAGSRVAVCVCLLAAAAVGLPSANAGSVTGRRTTQLGDGVHATFVWVNGAGANANNACGIGWTSGGDFTIDNLPGGSYWLAASEHDWYRHYIGPSVLVPATGPVNVPIRDRSTYDTTGVTDLGDAVWAAQTFVATGKDVAIAMVLSATDGARVTVTIRDGGPTGPVIGPGKIVTHGPLSPPVIRWAPGEVPTIPGRLYAIRQDGVGGARWRPSVSYQTNPYPNGQAWFDGVYRPEADLRVAIASRDDGLIDEYRVDNWWRPTSNTEVVQTFVPAGRELRLAQMMLAGSGTGYLMRASVHPWTGAFPLGPQVGPAKCAQMVADFFQAFVWGPGELPLTPGLPYAIRYVRADGGRFSVYGDSDAYPLGKAFFDGTPDGLVDLAGRLIIQEADRGDIAVSGLTCTPISSTDVRVTFATDVPTTATIACRTGTPIFDTIVPAEASPATSHDITIRHLTPGATCQMSILAHSPLRNVLRTAPASVAMPSQTARLAGRVTSLNRPVVAAKVILDELGTCTSSDGTGAFTFADAPTGRHTLRVEAVARGTVTQSVDVTPDGGATATVTMAAYSNLLSGTDNNPIGGWTRYGQFDGQFSNRDWGVTTHSGPKWVGSVGNFNPKTGGIYRTIATEPGVDYVFAGYVLTKAYDDPDNRDIQGLAVARIGVDPTGGTSPTGPNVVWGPWRFTAGTWKEIVVPFTAVGAQATLFAEHKHESYCEIPDWFIAGFDDLWVGTFQTLPAATPDLDGDGDVDPADFSLFQLCFNGPNQPPGANCLVNADFDTDADVDLTDFTTLAACFNGPNRTPACTWGGAEESR